MKKKYIKLNKQLVFNTRETTPRPPVSSWALTLTNQQTALH